MYSCIDINTNKLNYRYELPAPPSKKSRFYPLAFHRGMRRKRTKRTFALFIDAFIKLIKPQLHKYISKAKKCLKSPKNRHKCPITTPYIPPPPERALGGEATSFQIFLFFF